MIRQMSGRANRLSSFLFAAAFVLLFFLLAVLIVYTHNLMQFPYDYDQGEGFELVDTIMFSQGSWPYQNTEIYPFYSSNYPPLYHVILAPFVWIFGPAYWYGRLAGFIAAVIAALAISFAVYRDGGQNRRAAALSGLAFLASNMIYHISPLFRQHMTMVMFETLAVVVLAAAFPRQNRRWIAFGLLLMIAAGYTKQLAAISALAIFAWMFIRSPRRAVGWGMAFGALGGLILIWMNLSTNGEWWRQAILANANRIQILQSFGLFVLWFQLHGFLLIPAALLAIYELYFDRLSLYSLWFVFSAVLGGVGSGTWGGGDSYFATSIAAMCILSGIFASRSLNRAWNPRQNAFTRILLPLRSFPQPLILMLIPLLYLAYGRAALHLPVTGPIFEQAAGVFHIQPNVRGNFYDSASYDVPGYANIGYLTSPEDSEAGDRIVGLIEDTPQPVLSEEAGFSIAAARDVITNPTQLLNLANAGQFIGTELIRMIENQEFGLIILRAQFYPTPVLEAIGRAYERTEIIRMNGFDYLILRPIPDEN